MQDGVIVIDKPDGMTSHDVVSLIRRIAGMRKVGHGGTLDPLATGVLPIFIGKATRVIEYMSEKDDPRAKKYFAEMRLGVVSDTQDITGEVTVSTCDGFAAPSLSEIENALKSFEGEGEQIPPAYSAVKYKGRKLYDYARKGEEIPEEAQRKRRIFVDSIELTNYQSETLTAQFEITCSGGLYVRTICHDVGRQLGCGAVMSSLRRLKSGPYLIDDSITPEALEALTLEKGAEEMPLLPADSALINLPKAILRIEDARKFASGLRLSRGLGIAEEADAIAVYAGDAQSENFIGIGGYANKVLSPRKVLI